MEQTLHRYYHNFRYFGQKFNFGQNRSQNGEKWTDNLIYRLLDTYRAQKTLGHYSAPISPESRSPTLITFERKVIT